MKTNINLTTILAITSLSIFLSACDTGTVSFVKAKKLSSEAKTIKVVNDEPKDCRYLGEVIGSQGSGFSGAFTSNQNLELGARNEMKNKAAKLGADTIMILSNRKGQGLKFQTSSILYTGNAYRCNTN